MRTILATVMVALIAASCSNPFGSDLNVVKEGDGVSFVDAANRAVAERGRVSYSNPFGYLNNVVVKFKWDDGENIRDGQVVANGRSGNTSWYVAPSQCQYAPPEACDYSTVSDGTFINEEASLAAWPATQDCWMWPTRCWITGFVYGPDPSCGSFGPCWHFVKECQDGCPPGAEGMLPPKHFDGHPEPPIKANGRTEPPIK